jgi:4-amino-4-deoxy-L-arabinose transferase-like glycosyltransferase
VYDRTVKARVVWGIAILSAVAIAVSCAIWIRQNPLPSYYDEALYSIYATIDVWAATNYGLSGAWFAMLTVDPVSPPAMRMLALPVTLLSSPSLTLLRAISLAGFFAAAIICAIVVKRVAGGLAGAFAFLFLVSLPILVLSTRMFGTEYPLLLAVACVLAGLTARHGTLLIAAGVALGLLAKASFVIVAAPMLAVGLLLMKEKRRSILVGGAVGLLISLSWWTHDPMKAIQSGSAAANFVRHTLGRNPLRYAWELLRCGFGFGVSAALTLCFAAALRSRRLPALSVVCLAGALPLIGIHVLSVNHNPRIVAVAVMLIALAAAVVTPTLPRWQQSVVLALVALQAVVMVAPFRHPEDGSYIWRGVSEVMAPVEQWDWKPLHELAVARGMERPRIATLGEAYAFNPPQIRFAWPELRGFITVASMYECSEGKAFDLATTIDRAAQSDMVVTAVGYRGEATDGQTPNNRYNALFASALARDRRFEGPLTLKVGVRHPAHVQVFIRRRDPT